MHATVTQILASTFTYPVGHPEGPGPAYLFVYLIRTADAAVLVDTGIGVGHRWIEENYKPIRRDLLAALAEHEIEPTSLSALVCSHLHFDHCGNNCLFPGKPIYVQRAEFEDAANKGYTAAEWVNFSGANYKVVEGAARIGSSIELLPTPGHTRGHQSVVVATARGPEVIVAQAAYTAAEFESYAKGTPEVRQDAWSGSAYVASLEHLHQLRPQRAYFSHDQAVYGEA
jgi:N-acyl homoserine lactone hydrolase